MIRGGTAGTLTKAKSRGKASIASPSVPYPAGLFRGMNDSLDPAVARSNYARLLQNCYPIDPFTGSAVVGRPGFQKAGSQLGASSKRTGQLVYEYTKRDGTTKTVAIVGGQGIYTFNWSTRAWTQSVTVANLTSASITLSETSRCYAVTFNDKLVISDGVNKPFTWDGTAGGGLAALTNASVMYGQPVVYYAKLFGIKNTERSTLIWSEENDPTTGYEAGGYNNAWTLAQTNSEGFFALCATDEALYCFRGRSITKIQGAVTPSFSSTGTREGVSEEVGTSSSASVVRTSNGNIYFLDSLGRPQGIVPGGGMIDPPVWTNVRETVRGVDLTAATIAKAQSWYDPETRTVGLGYAESGQTICGASIHLAPQTSEPVAQFRGFTFDRVGTVYNANMRRVLMHLSGDGYAYDHGTEDGDLWDDELNAGTQAIAHRVLSMPLGFDATVDKHWTRLDLSLRITSAMTFSVQYETPRGNNTAQSLSVAITGGYAIVGTAVVGTDLLSSGEWIETHEDIGWNGFGRWLAWNVTHETVGERFGLATATAHARPLNASPGIA